MVQLYFWIHINEALFTSRRYIIKATQSPDEPLSEANNMRWASQRFENEAGRDPGHEYYTKAPNVRKYSHRSWSLLPFFGLIRNIGGKFGQEMVRLSQKAKAACLRGNPKRFVDCKIIVFGP